MPIDTRWLFWDGIPNVDGGTIKNDVNNSFSLAGAATPFTPVAQAVPGSGQVVVSTPSVTVERVDPWFAPIDHVLGIQVRLNNMRAFNGLLLRIYAGDTCVYHRAYSGDDLTKLRTDNPRTADLARGVTQGNPWKAESIKNKALLKEQPDAVRYTVACWVAPNAITLRAIVGQMTRLKISEALGNVHVAEERLGQNQTLVCSLVEAVMSGTTKLIFYDRESPDRIFNGATPEGVISPAKTARDSHYPTFKPVMYDLLYQVATHTPIGLALLRDVSSSANGTKIVEAFPTRTLHKSMGGSGVSDAFPDDFAIESKLTEIRTALKAAAPAAPFAALAPADQPVDDSATPLSAVELAKEAKLNPKGKATNKFDYAVRRWLYKKIGLSSGGSRVRFYFNLDFINLLNNGGYPVAHHKLKKVWDITFQGKPRKVFEATVTYIKADKIDETVSVETPFFVAFLHELVHARRMQLGLNAEWDAVANSALHPDAFISVIKSDARKDDPDFKKFIRNLIAGYNNKNREEYDTVEGEGAPLKLSGAAEVRARTLNLPITAGVIQVNENTIRKDIAIDLRYLYEDNRKDPKEATYQGQPQPDFTIRRKFPPPVMNNKMRVPVEPKLSEIGAGFAKLLTDVGSPAKAFVIEPDVNCVLFDSIRFGAAYRFGVLAKRLHASYPEADQGEYQGIAENIAMSRAWLVKNLPLLAPALLAGNTAEIGPAPKSLTRVGDKGRINAMRMLQAIAAIQDATERALVLDKLDKAGQSVRFGAAVLAQAGLKLGLVLEEGKDWSADQDARCLNLQQRLVDAPQYAHMLVHESMHVQSFEGEGFTTWKRPEDGSTIATTIIKAPPPAPGEDPQPDRPLDWANLCSVLNEGTTELFARLVSYRINKAAGKVVAEAEKIEDLLSYEFPTRFCAALVRLIDAKKAEPGAGLKLLGQAFFDGKFPAFAAAWNELDAAAVLLIEGSRLDINNGPYKGPGAPLNALTKLNADAPEGAAVGLPTPVAAEAALQDNKYLDPVLKPAPLVADLAGYKPSYSSAL